MDLTSFTKAKSAYNLASKNKKGFAAIDAGGLSVSIDSGSLGLYGGSYINFPGGTVTVLNNNTNEIMLDLFDKTLHVFPRAIHRGAVHIATVVTSGGKITSITQPATFRVPASRIEKYKRKAKPKLALLGDSLVDGAGDVPRWTDLLFSVTYAAQGYQVSNFSNLTFDNYAVGGQTSHFGLVQLGRAVTSSTNGKYDNTVITHGQSYLIRNIDSPSTVKESKIISGQYDLAFVEFGANGGTYHLGHLENIIRDLRRLGTEVIIGTSNYRSDNTSFLYSDGDYLIKLAETYGCEIADTWSYVWESENLKGNNCHYDVIHMSTSGHVAWASAVRSVMNDLKQEAASIPPTNQSRIIPAMYTDSSGISAKLPNKAEVQFTPMTHTGTVIAGTQTDERKNPAIAYGGKTASNYITQLTTGQYAWFGHAGASALDFLVDLSYAFTADLYTQNGATKIGTISSTTVVAGRVGLIEGLGVGTFGTATAGNSGLINRAVQVIVTSGTMNVVGAVFYTWNKSELLFDDIAFKGTWAEESIYYSPSNSKWTDTDGDSFYFEFVGSGCRLLFNSKTASGKIDVYFDGELRYNQADLYSTGSFVSPLNLFPYSSSDIFDKGYGKHTVKVKLHGTNASADASTVSGNRRLQLVNVYIYDSR